jgi:hypothetical protein
VSSHKYFFPTEALGISLYLLSRGFCSWRLFPVARSFLQWSLSNRYHIILVHHWTVVSQFSFKQIPCNYLNTGLCYYLRSSFTYESFNDIVSSLDNMVSYGRTRNWGWNEVVADKSSCCTDWEEPWKFSKNNQFPDWDLNSETRKYEAGVLVTLLQCYIKRSCLEFYVLTDWT